MHENSEAFLGIGTNLSWNQNLPEYKSHFEAYKNNKMNFARVWMSTPFAAHFLLEWTGTKQVSNIDTVSFSGLGKYNQEDAHKLDWLLQQTKNNDVTLMLTLFTYHNFWNWANENPYAAYTNGDGKTNVDEYRCEKNISKILFVT